MNKECIVHKATGTILNETEDAVIVKFKHEHTVQKFEKRDNELLEDGEVVGKIYPVGTDVEAILMDMQD